MKNLSIKVRVTLWYTLLMTVLLGAVLALLFSLGERQIVAASQSQLKQIVHDSLDEIEYDDGELEIDDDLRLYQNGVYVIVCNESGEPIYGTFPTAFLPELRHDELQTVETDSGPWVTYDFQAQVEGKATVWVRGVMVQNEATGSLWVLLRLASVLLPLFVVMIALGGGYITYRAFKPVEQMRKTAEDIAQRSDFSQRIALGKGRDELYQLGRTFDQMLDRLQEAFEREKQFTSDASHELRTPVAVITSQAEYVLRHDDLPPETEQHLQVILSQAQRMSGLIGQLLMLSRADRGQLKLQQEPVALPDLLEAVCETAQDRAGGKHISIHWDLEPGVTLLGDETLLMRCFMNLLDNAVCYGREGGNVWVTLRQQGHSIQVQVRDDGIGIAPDQVERIWERFYQVDPVRSSENGNSGLGLSMVRWIAEAHGGTATVESRPGQGSTFTVTLTQKEIPTKKI